MGSREGEKMDIPPTSDRPGSRSAVLQRLLSFRYAAAGIWAMLRSQQNAWIHAAATAAVLVAGLTFRINPLEWCVVTLAIIAVWTAEALNTAFEFLADVASPGFHPLVKKAKDVAAGAVLVAAFGAAVAGVLVFAPRIAGLLNG